MTLRVRCLLFVDGCSFVVVFLVGCRVVHVVESVLFWYLLYDCSFLCVVVLFVVGCLLVVVVCRSLCCVVVRWLFLAVCRLLCVVLLVGCWLLLVMC